LEPCPETDTLEPTTVRLPKNGRALTAVHGQQREGEAEPSALTIAGWKQLGSTIMRVHDRLNDGETESRASAAARSIAATKALKNRLSELFPDAGSIIGDDDERRYG
jgi:hypothetical protein